MPASTETQDLAQAYKQLAQAEAQAQSLEHMLDKLESKMDSILEAAEGLSSGLAIKTQNEAAPSVDLE